MRSLFVLFALLTQFTSVKSVLGAILFRFGIDIFNLLYIPGLQMVIPLAVIIGMWTLFRKANRPSWTALIPFYNIKVLGQISGVSSIVSAITIVAFVVVNLSFLSMVFYSPVLSIFANPNIRLLALAIVLFGWIKIVLGLRDSLNLSTLNTVLLTLFPFILLPMLGLNGAEFNYFDSSDSAEGEESGATRYSKEKGSTKRRVGAINGTVLSGLSHNRFMKFKSALEEEQAFEKVIGGKLHTDIGYLIIMGIPLWFKCVETFFFVSENGIYTLEKTFGKGITEVMFIPNETFAGIRLTKKKISRSLSITYPDKDVLTYDANSGTLPKFLGTNLDRIKELNPTISISGDYIPGHFEEHINEPQFAENGSSNVGDPRCPCATSRPVQE